MTEVTSGHLRTVLDRVTELWVPAFVFLLIACSLNHDPRAVSDMTYIVILVFVLGGVPLGLRRGGRIDGERFSVIPIILIGLWIYGVVLGLTHGLSPSVVFRNFAAMSLFFVYYVLLLLSPSLKQILLGLYAGAAAFVLAVVYLVIFSETKGSFGEIGFGALRYHYFLGTVIAAAVMITLMVQTVVTGPLRIMPLLAGALIFVAFFLSGSRAFYLALAVSMAAVCLAFVFAGWKYVARAAAVGAAFVLLGAITTMVMVDTSSGVVEVAQTVGRSVAAETTPRGPRFETGGVHIYPEGVRVDQFNALVAELSLFGRGLGAPLSSGFSRDALGYGFELSYLSLGHKLGILGLGIFLACAAFQYFRTLRTLIRSNYRPAMIVTLGMLGFLVSSYGNPTLFAPIFVSFFCVALYIERTVARDLATGPQAQST